MNETKEENKECDHIFRLQRIEIEQNNVGFIVLVFFFYKKVGYVVCEKCGKIIKQDL